MSCPVLKFLGLFSNRGFTTFGLLFLHNGRGGATFLLWPSSFPWPSSLWQEESFLFAFIYSLPYKQGFWSLLLSGKKSFNEFIPNSLLLWDRALLRSSGCSWTFGVPRTGVVQTPNSPTFASWSLVRTVHLHNWLYAQLLLPLLLKSSISE